MANETQQVQGKGAAIPTEFRADQMFVAVSDGDGPAAGFDGGPEKGGTGAWARGDIRQWTASGAVPLALRDPKDGTIVKGWLEPVEQVGEKNGRAIALKSTKFFATRNGKTGAWEPAKPSDKALARATRGATPLTAAFATVAQRAQTERLAGAGIHL